MGTCQNLVQTEQGYVIFDDTVLDKRYARNIALARRQYSGNAKGVINGIGVVNNPDLELGGLVFTTHTDGKTKLDHVKEMLSHSVYHKRLLRCYGSWYAAKVAIH